LTGSFVNPHEIEVNTLTFSGISFDVNQDIRDIKKGEELDVDYVPKIFGVEMAERLKNYGL
jgi:hypothetical protein